MLKNIKIKKCVITLCAVLYSITSIGHDFYIKTNADNCKKREINSVAYFLNSVTATNACKRDNTSNVTLNSSADGLPIGDYLVTYSLSYNGNSTALTAPMTVSTAGVGSFVANVSIVNVNSSTTIKINSLKSLATAAVSNLSSNNISNVSKMVSVTNKPNITNVYATCANYIIQWNNDSADEYFLDVATDTNFSTFLSGYQNKALGNVISHEILGMIQGQTYYCRIRSKNYCGISIDSNVKSFTKIGYGWINPISGGTNSIAIGASAPAFSNATSGGTWSIINGTGTATIEPRGSSSNLAVVIGNTPGTATVVYTVNNNGCYTSVTKPITITNSTQTTSSVFINNTKATDACKKDNTSNVTLNSSAEGLPIGDYAVTYSLSYNGNSTSLTAPMTVSNAGAGSFAADVSIVNVNSSTTIKINSLKSLATAAVSNLSSNNISNVSKMVSVTTKPNINNVYATCANYIIQWNNDSADEYFLDVATDKNFSTFLSGYQNKALGNVFSHEILGMIQGQTYYCRIRSKNYCGISIDSDVKSFTKIGNGWINPILGGTDSIAIGASTPAFSNATAGGTWSIINGTGTATIEPRGSSSNLAVVTGTIPGTATVVYTVNNNGCYTSVTKSIIITNTPSLFTNNIIASDACKRDNTSNVTLSSSEEGLPIGDYIVTYSLSYNGNSTSLTAPMTVSNAGTGSFAADVSIVNTNSSTTIKINSLKSLATAVVTNLSSNNISNVSKMIGVTNKPIITTIYATCANYIIQWNNDSADEYFLDVATDINFSTFLSGYQNKALGNVISHEILGMIQGQTYYCRIRSKNYCGISVDSDVKPFTKIGYGGISPILGGTDSIAIGASTPAFSNATSGGTWSIINGTGSATIDSSGIVTGTSLGSCTIVYTVDNGCTSSAILPITVIIKNTIILTSNIATANQTICVNKNIANVTYSTTGNAEATVIGLPPGITGNWVSPTLTITGMSTLAGNFTYTITLIGENNSQASTGTITVLENPTIQINSALGTDNQTKTINQSITPISYITSGAATVNFSGLPPGIIGNFTNNIVTITGSPTTSGEFIYSILLSGNCDTSITGKINTLCEPIIGAIKIITITSTPYSFSNPGKTSAALACQEAAFPIKFYASTSTLNVNNKLYSNEGLTISVNGGNLWYQNKTNSIAYKIDNTGKIVEIYSCSTPPIGNSSAFQFSYSDTTATLACSQVTFPLTLYSASSTLSIGIQMYSNANLTTPVASGNLWYHLGADAVSYRIDDAGKIAEVFSCTPTPTTKTYFYQAKHAWPHPSAGYVNYIDEDGIQQNWQLSRPEDSSTPCEGIVARSIVSTYDVIECIPDTGYPFLFSNPGRTSASLACSQTSFTNKFYTATSTLGIGTQMYLNANLTAPVGSGDLWYQLGIDGISYRIDNTGKIAETYSCSTLPPINSYAFQFSDSNATAASACSQVTFPLTFYSASTILGIGTKMYLNADLTNPVVSADLWYQLGIAGVLYRIDYVGRITETYSCSTPPIITGNAFQFSYSDTTATLACSQVTFPLTLYSPSNTLDIGTKIYSDINLTTTVVGDNLWYQLNTNGISYQIDNTGKIAATFSCIEYPCTANVTASQYSKTIAALQGTAITLSSTTPGTTFSWTVIQSGVMGATAGNGNFINQTLTNWGTTTGTATYTITPTFNNCSGTPIIVVITVKPAYLTIEYISTCRYSGSCENNDLCGIKIPINCHDCPGGSNITLTVTGGESNTDQSLRVSNLAGVYNLDYWFNGTGKRTTIFYKLTLTDSEGTVLGELEEEMAQDNDWARNRSCN